MSEKSSEFVAGATGLEPAASSVTGQRESNESNDPFDSCAKKSGPNGAAFDSGAAGVESENPPPRPSLFRRLLVRLMSALGRRPCRHCGAIERRKVRTRTGSFIVCGNCWGRP